MHSLSSLVMQFENSSAQEKAISLIPTMEIYSKVETKMRELQQASIKQDESFNETTALETIFLYEIMKWFKNDFFKWFDIPTCPKCKNKTIFSEMSSNDNAERVEVSTYSKH